MAICRCFCNSHEVSAPPKEITVAELATLRERLTPRPATHRLTQTLRCPPIQRFYEFLLRALKQRAMALGWLSEHIIIIIDNDLGQSGASAADRGGFDDCFRT